MSSQTPPQPCDIFCLQKFFQDNNGASLRLSQVADDAEHLYRGHLEGKVTIPADLLAAMPGLITKLQQVRQATIELRDDWRKACGYKGQGLTP